MDIRTALTTNPVAAPALAELAAQLGVGADGPRPDFIALHCAEGLAEAFGRLAMDALDGAGALHGGTTCLGVMTDKGVATAGGTGSGAFAIFDPEGSYGTGAAELGDDPRGAARSAVLAALRQADREGESPSLVWLTTAPGAEEAVLDGVRDIVGDKTPVVGGSSADNTIAGNWAQFSGDRLLRNGVVVSVLFPSGGVSTAFQGGYTPSPRSGVVTAAEGRRLISIDGEPAATVYARWTDNAVLPALTTPRSILADSTLNPLGRVSDNIAGVPMYLLIHPATSNPDGSIELFADVQVGDRLWQMEGTQKSLIERAGQVARASLEADLTPAGALIVYCAGCMLAQPHRMDAVADSLREALNDTPFLCVFTFGEQGYVTPAQSRHGNLMISSTVFGQEP